MPVPYSLGLRRVVVAVDTGAATQAQRAARFGVSLNWVKKLPRQWRSAIERPWLCKNPKEKETLRRLLSDLTGNETYFPDLLLRQGTVEPVLGTRRA